MTLPVNARETRLLASGIRAAGDIKAGASAAPKLILET